MAETPPMPPTPPARLLFPSMWADLKATPIHWLQGAMAHAQWQDGVSLITEAEFDAAVEAVQDMPITAIPPSEV